MRTTARCLVGMVLLAAACGSTDDRYDKNVSVPKGDPSFPPLVDSWVIDEAGVLSEGAIAEGDAILERLKADGVAEVIVVTIRGVKQPETWATHYGRWLGLGRKGFSTEGGNRGLVWLVRPDAPDKLTISVGRGLPRFTTVDYGPIIESAVQYFNFNNYDRGVLTLVAETDRVLRALNSNDR